MKLRYPSWLPWIGFSREPLGRGDLISLGYESHELPGDFTVGLFDVLTIEWFGWGIMLAAFGPLDDQTDQAGA
jgi:hypothetical protein